MNPWRRRKPKQKVGTSILLYSSLLLCALALPFLAGFYPIVRFPEEQIDIEIHPDHVWIIGTYVYKKPLPFPVIQSFTVLLPADTDHPNHMQTHIRFLP